jgi:hypothetical protein
MMSRSFATGLLALLATPAVAFSAPEIISGYVFPDGSVLVRSASYTVSHLGVGEYQISFTNRILPNANCTISPFYGAYVAHLHVSPEHCSFYFQREFNGVPNDFDAPFTFIAVPMSN